MYVTFLNVFTYSCIYLCISLMPSSGRFMQLLFFLVQNGPSGDESDPGRLTIHNVTKSDSGWYTCVVSNRFGSVHRGAWLQVNPHPSFVSLSSLSTSDFTAAIGATVGVMVVVLVVAFVAVVIVWRRSKRRPAVISFIKSAIYGHVPLTVPDDPEWEILQEK